MRADGVINFLRRFLSPKVSSSNLEASVKSLLDELAPPTEVRAPLTAALIERMQEMMQEWLPDCETRVVVARGALNHPSGLQGRREFNVDSIIDGFGLTNLVDSISLLDVIFSPQLLMILIIIRVENLTERFFDYME